MTIQENILLKEHTTFKIGGPAQYFVEIFTIDELQKAVSIAKEKSLPIFILGGGSNILVADSGFQGLVIKICIKGKEMRELSNEKVEVIVGAGEDWDSFVGYTVEHNLFGLENLSYIPGSVGATPVQNIGAYGTEVKDTISWVEVFNTEKNSIEKFSNKECLFDYRDSYFKKTEGKKYIIIRVAFLLSRHGTLSIDYKDVRDYIAANNLSDLTDSSAGRTNLGLGTLATQDGTFSGTSSGTNTGDQTITLTGAVTGSGTGSFVTTLASGTDAVKIADGSANFKRHLR